MAGSFFVPRGNKRGEQEEGTRIRHGKGSGASGGGEPGGRAGGKLCKLYCTKHSDEPLKAKIVFSRGFHDFLSFISIVQKTFTQLPAPPCLLAPPRLPAAQCPLPFPYRIFGLLFNAEKVSAVFLFIFGPPLYHSV